MLLFCFINPRKTTKNLLDIVKPYIVNYQGASQFLTSRRVLPSRTLIVTNIVIEFLRIFLVKPDLVDFLPKSLARLHTATKEQLLSNSLSLSPESQVSKPKQKYNVTRNMVLFCILKRNSLINNLLYATVKKMCNTVQIFYIMHIAFKNSKVNLKLYRVSQKSLHIFFTASVKKYAKTSDPTRII